MEKIIAKNKKAFHDFHISDAYEAGVELKGTEVKSCRAGSISLNDSYVRISSNEAILMNVNISPYDKGNIFNHDPVRPRKLLLHKREIRKLAQSVHEKGFTIVPLKVYFKGGIVKFEIAIAKGKTHGDKRETLRGKQDALDTKRAMSVRRRM